MFFFSLLHPTPLACLPHSPPPSLFNPLPLPSPFLPLLPLHPSSLLFTSSLSPPRISTVNLDLSIEQL